MAKGGMHGGRACMGVCLTGETVTAADGTHPTGMHSWFEIVISFFIFIFGQICKDFGPWTQSSIE